MLLQRLQRVNPQLRLALRGYGVLSKTAVPRRLALPFRVAAVTQRRGVAVTTIATASRVAIVGAAAAAGALAIQAQKVLCSAKPYMSALTLYRFYHG